MQAILMAGGRGTRLRPFTKILPKALVPIGDISILEMVLRQLGRCGFSRATIAVGHKAELIMAVVGEGRRFGVEVTYHYEEEPLGTIGALAYVDALDDNFLVMNADICTNLNFRELLDAHVATGALATVGTYARREQIELGVLKVDEETRAIIGFEEKPTHDFMVCMGVNAFQKSIVDLVPKGKYFGFDDLMHQMLRRGLDVRSWLFQGVWHDIGRPDDYDRMLRQYETNPELFLPQER